MSKSCIKYLSLEQIAFLLSGLHITIEQAKDLADGKTLPSRSHLVILIAEYKWDLSNVLTNGFDLANLLTLTPQELLNFEERKALAISMLGDKVAYANVNRLDTILFTLEDLGQFTDKEIAFIINSLISSGFVRCETFGYSKDRLKQYKFGLPGIFKGAHY